MDNVVRKLLYDDLRKRLISAKELGRPIVFVRTNELEAIRYVLDYQNVVGNYYTEAPPNQPVKRWSSVLFKLPAFTEEKDGLICDISQPTLFVLFANETEMKQLHDTATIELNRKLFLFMQLYKNVSTRRKVGEESRQRITRESILNSMILIVTPEIPQIPDNIALYSEYIQLDPPDEDALRRFLSALLHELDPHIEMKEEIDGKGFYVADRDYLDVLVKQFKGLSSVKIDQIMRKIQYTYRQVYWPDFKRDEKFEKEVLRLIQGEKEQLIATSSILHLEKSSSKQASGLGNLERYLREKEVFVNDMDRYKRDWAVNAPKGILIAGIPGSGKSLMARYTAHLLNIPLIKMDMGDVQNKFVGESERRMVEALELVNAMSPCVLWVDEIEKSFAGSSGNSSSDVTQRLFGKFLTWMQEKEKKEVCCFVFATANDVSKLPPELFRSGRFDAKFYTYMPTAEECGEIFESLIQSLCADYARFHERDLYKKRLFDMRAVHGELFISLLNSDLCLSSPIGVEETRVSRENKFFTGADIENVIKRAQELYILRKQGSGKEYVYETMRFTECLKAAIREIKTYGETDLEKIASCYAKMAYNNFSPAAEGIKIAEKERISLMPFEGYDEYRKENGEYILYRLKEESKHVENLRNAYDKCLFCAVRNVLNRDRDAIVNSKKLYT